MKPYVLLVAFAFGCAEGAKVNIVQSVGTQGGNVAVPDGTNLAIPAGAVATQTMITIQSVSASAPAGTVQVGPAYDFGPEGATFSMPVTITLPFDASKIPSGRSAADVRVYTAPKGSNQYTIAATTIESGVLAKTNTNHFTVYLPAVPMIVGDGPRDMAGMVARDMAMPRDMAMASDMAMPSGCTPSCQIFTGEGCECTATCGGKVYKISCFGTTALSCTCTTDGQTSGVASVSSCNGTNERNALLQQCVPN